MEVALIADTHIGDPLAKNNSSIENLGKVIAEINCSSVSHVFFLGDLVLPGFHEKFKNIVQRLNVPYSCMVGNNDKKDKVKEEIFPICVDRPLYCFSHAGNYFIFIDVTIKGSHNGYITASLAYDIDKKLSSIENAENIFLLMHIPPSQIPFQYLDEEEKKWRMETESRKRLLDITHKHKISAIICGHRHKAENFPFGNTQVITVPSTCWNDDTTPLGYVLLETNKTYFKFKNKDINFDKGVDCILEHSLHGVI